MPEDKTQWNNGISVKKDVPLKTNNARANNCKRFIPVINFHVLKADLLVVATLLNEIAENCDFKDRPPRLTWLKAGTQHESARRGLVSLSTVSLNLIRRAGCVATRKMARR